MQRKIPFLLPGMRCRPTSGRARRISPRDRSLSSSARVEVSLNTLRLALAAGAYLWRLAPEVPGSDVPAMRRLVTCSGGRARRRDSSRGRAEQVGRFDQRLHAHRRMGFERILGLHA